MGGGILLVQYHSLFQLLSTIYSDFKWNKQLFSSSSSKDIWTDDHLANYFVQWLKKQPENQVLRVNQVIREMRLGYSPLTQLLASQFVQHKWIIYPISKNKKSQYMLKECIQNLFLNKEKDLVLLEEYKHPDIANLELDYFLPQYNIAFEYQVSLKVSKSYISRDNNIIEMLDFFIN